MSIKQIKSLVQFTRGNSLVWAALSTPIPDGVVVFSIDDGVFKLGDGVDTYPNLPALFTFNDLVSAQGGTSTIFEIPTVAQNGNIVIIEFDNTVNRIMYSVSNVTLSSLLDSIAGLEADSSNRSSEIANIMAIALSLDASINTGTDGNIITIINGRYTDSGSSAASVHAQVAAGTTYTPGSHILDPIWYTTPDMVVKADGIHLYDKNTYYIDIPAFNNSTPTPVVELTCANPNISITKVESGTSDTVFSVKFNNVCSDVKDRIPVIFITSCDDGTGNATVRKAFATVILRNRILECVYGGTSDDIFNGVAIDRLGSIICVGKTTSEGSNGDALVVKFDTNLNIIKRVRYGGSSLDTFNFVDTDSSNNIICVGLTQSEGFGGSDALVVKYDTDLNVLSRKVYGGSNTDIFQAIAVDNNNNIICAGSTSSEGAGSDDALVVKFDTNLNIINRVRYGGNATDMFYAVAVDISNNIICAGITYSEGTNGDALVVKFDTNLNITDRVRYGGSNLDMFMAVATDSTGNVICAGSTNSEGTNGEALVVKFSSSLGVVSKKTYGGSNSEQFNGVAVDSLDNVICVGFTYSEGTNGAALVVKYDSNLEVVSKKVYGGTSIDTLTAVTTDAANNIICSGNTSSVGFGSKDALVLKLPATIPSGTFVGTVLTGLSLSDSYLSTATSALTSATSVLTLAASSLTLTASGLTSTASSLSLVNDTIN